MKDNLALFDLDGTLFDTSNVNYLAYKKALEPFGVRLDKEHFIEKCNGKHYTEFLPRIMGTDEYLEEVHKSKKKYYAEYLGEARVNKHLFNIISFIGNKYYKAIVTTASKQNTTDILKHFGYENIFDRIISQEDISKTKPDPEGFLRAMQIFNIDAKHTVIFEDSDVGVEAANKTGATVFIVGRF